MLLNPVIQVTSTLSHFQIVLKDVDIRFGRRSLFKDIYIDTLGTLFKNYSICTRSVCNRFIGRHVKFLQQKETDVDQGLRQPISGVPRPTLQDVHVLGAFPAPQNPYETAAIRLGSE